MNPVTNASSPKSAPHIPPAAKTKEPPRLPVRLLHWERLGGTIHLRYRGIWAYQKLHYVPTLSGGKAEVRTILPYTCAATIYLNPGGNPWGFGLQCNPMEAQTTPPHLALHDLVRVLQKHHMQHIASWISAEFLP